MENISVEKGKEVNQEEGGERREKGRSPQLEERTRGQIEVEKNGGGQLSC